MRPADLIERPELAVAAKWWCNTLLSNFVDDTGDFKVNAFVNAMKGKRHPWDIPNERNVTMFRDALVGLMAVRFADGWDDANPNFGSANRTLGVDYGPDKILTCALDFASISSTMTLPIKTMMWVSPKSVKVREGYHGKEMEVQP
jgi:hypothetical protein